MADGPVGLHREPEGQGAGACDVDGKNLTVLPGVREFCKSKEDQITEFLKRKKRLETLGPMNLEDAYYYYKYIINGEEFKPTSIYARENKKPEELIGGKYDPDWTNRNTRQPFAQAEPPSSSDSEGPGPDESRQRDVPREKRRAKKRIDKEKYIKARREQNARITNQDNEAIEANFPEEAMRREIKAGRGARKALIQKALPSKEPEDDMDGSDGEGGAPPPPPPGPPPPPPPPPEPKTPPLAPQPGPSQPPETVARPSAPPPEQQPLPPPPPPPEPQAGPSRPPEVVAAEAVAVAAARAVLEQVPVAVQAQLANAGIEIAPSSPREKEATDKRRAAYKDAGRRPGYTTMDGNDATDNAVKKVKEAAESHRAGLLKQIRSGTRPERMEVETPAERAVREQAEAAESELRAGFLETVSSEITRAAGDEAVQQFLAGKIDYNQLAAIAQARATGVNRQQAQIAEQHRDISDLGGDIVKFYEAEREEDPLGSAAKGPFTERVRRVEERAQQLMNLEPERYFKLDSGLVMGYLDGRRDWSAITDALRKKAYDEDLARRGARPLIT
eukprot:tig00021137_g19010.t1